MKSEGENTGEIVIKEEPITAPTTGEANTNDKAPNVSYVADTYIMTKEEDIQLLQNGRSADDDKTGEEHDADEDLQNPYLKIAKEE